MLLATKAFSQLLNGDTASPEFNFDSDKVIITASNTSNYALPEFLINGTKYYDPFGNGLKSMQNGLRTNIQPRTLGIVIDGLLSYFRFQPIPDQPARIDPMQPWTSLADPNLYRRYVEQDGFRRHRWYLTISENTSAHNRVHMTPWQVPVIAQAKLRPGVVPVVRSEDGDINIPWDVLHAIQNSSVMVFDVFYFVSPAYLALLSEKILHRLSLNDLSYYYRLSRRLFMWPRADLLDGEILDRRNLPSQLIQILNNITLNVDGLPHGLGSSRESILLVKQFPKDFSNIFNSEHNLTDRGLNTSANMSLYGHQALFQYMTSTKGQYLAALKVIAEYVDGTNEAINAGFNFGQSLYIVGNSHYDDATQFLHDRILSLQQEEELNTPEGRKDPEEWAVKLRTQSIQRFPADLPSKRMLSVSAKSSSTSPVRPLLRDEGFPRATRYLTYDAAGQ